MTKVEKNTGYWMLDAGNWMLDAGCWMLDIGCWMDFRLIQSFLNYFALIHIIPELLYRSQ